MKLPDEVANQIAAGEVVERPASVVKELVENAVDAGATRIHVEVEEGGQGLIRVTDDGIGMSREDAELCLLRHATSKIVRVEDLETVGTFGFRGEAIPSIASVCRFRLTTRRREDTEGTEILVEGGAPPSISAAGAAPGTVVEARDLFFNVPARKKFLKRPATEMSHVTDAVSRLAMANRKLSFKLSSAGRTVFDVPPEVEHDPRARLSRLLGKSVAERMYPVPLDEVPHAIEVLGFISAPDLSERTTRGIHVFVNGRYVRDRTIQHAISDAYRTLLERGRHPVVVLFISLDPKSFDVNVHPQKTEVRFARTSDIHRAVSGALSRALATQPWLIQPTGGATRTYSLNKEKSAYAEHRGRSAGATGPRSGGPSAAREPVPAKAIASYMDLIRPLPQFREPDPPQAEAPLGGRFSTLSPVGQVLGTYLVCQAPDRMVVIDQHAAHERIAFERMRTQRKKRALEVQPLLVPLSIELDEARAGIAADEAERLRAVGLELEHFGGRTWVVKSAPSALGKVALDRLVLDLLDELKEVGETSSHEEAIEALLSCAACHTAVRAGDRLSNAEIAELLTQMDEIDFGAHCPHGRPVFREWTAGELARMFHRT